jgi:hypothetical protein
MLPVLRFALGRSGWYEKEPGLLWRDAVVSTVSSGQPINRYGRIMEAIQRGIGTIPDLSRETGYQASNVGVIVRRMMQQGNVARERITTGHLHYRYTWVGQGIPADAVRPWTDYTGRYARKRA